MPSVYKDKIYFALENIFKKIFSCAAGMGLNACECEHEAKRQQCSGGEAQ